MTNVTYVDDVAASIMAAKARLLLSQLAEAAAIVDNVFADCGLLMNIAATKATAGCKLRATEANKMAQQVFACTQHYEVVG